MQPSAQSVQSVQSTQIAHNTVRDGQICNTMSADMVSGILRVCSMCKVPLTIQICGDRATIRIIYKGVIYYRLFNEVCVEYIEHNTFCACNMDFAIEKYWCRLAYCSSEGVLKYLVFNNIKSSNTFVQQMDVLFQIEQGYWITSKNIPEVIKVVNLQHDAVVNQEKALGTHGVHCEIVHDRLLADCSIEVIPMERQPKSGVQVRINDQIETPVAQTTQKQTLYQQPVEVINSIFECINSQVSFKDITILMRVMGITPQDMLTDEFLQHAVQNLGMKQTEIDFMIREIVEQHVDPDKECVCDPNWNVSRLSVFDEDDLIEYYEYLLGGASCGNFSYILDQLTIGMTHHPENKKMHSQSLIRKLLKEPEDGIEYGPIIAQLVPFI